MLHCDQESKVSPNMAAQHLYKSYSEYKVHSLIKKVKQLRLFASIYYILIKTYTSEKFMIGPGYSAFTSIKLHSMFYP